MNASDPQDRKPAHAFLHREGRRQGGGRGQLRGRRAAKSWVSSASPARASRSPDSRSSASSIRRAGSWAGASCSRARISSDLPAREMRAIRGRRIAMIFQDPMMTLNPVLSIETQMVETVLAHEKVQPAGGASAPRDTLGMVGIPSPEERLAAYPHQFSGGMRQRVAIAIALLHRPELIIADEPTTALDVTIQSQILAQIQGSARELGMALVWISHDLGVVAGLAHRIAVMYAGRIVEIGPTDDVLDRPVHPYTIGLLQSVPANVPRGAPLRAIPGMAPSPLASPVWLRLPPALRFRDRDLRDGAAARRRPAPWHGAASILRRGEAA